MYIEPKIIKYLKNVPNSAYDSIKTEFLYHSNKLEGSTFSKENLEKYLQEHIVEGTHKIDDIHETINSTKVFDFIIDTLYEPLSKRLLLEFHQMLKNNTLDQERGFAGCWKKIPNQIAGRDIKLSQPHEVETKIEELLQVWQESNKDLQNIVQFHVQFEHIHPFQDGNGRIGRFVMLKQCLENHVDVLFIDDQYEKEYKDALYRAQVQNEYTDLFEIFKKSQDILDSKLSFLKETIEYIKDDIK